VRVAANEAKFVADMNAAVREDGPSLQAIRRGIAAQNTWEQRLASISTAIEGRLQERLLPQKGAEPQEREVG